jgi:hydrogenase-4 component E
MTTATYVELLNLACGALLATAVLILWRQQLSSVIHWFAAQGVALGALAAILAVHGRDAELGVVAAAVLMLRAGLLPWLLRRALVHASAAGETGTATGHWSGAGTRAAAAQRETRPLVNVTASLLAVAVLTLIAYAVSQPLTTLSRSAAAHAIPIGVAVVLIGFFALVTRRRAISQLAAFLLMDNGITAVGFLTTASTSLIIELGVSLDVLLAAAVLLVLTSRLREAFGDADLDELKELRDS